MITSIQNPHIQKVRTLIRDSRERKSSGLYVVEGVRLVEEAIQSGTSPELIIYTQNLAERGMQLVQACIQKGVETLDISPDLLERISDTEQPQGILGVFPLQPLLEPPILDLVLILDAIRDPGNLGTILRTAAAAGVQSIWVAPGCVDPYSPKVLRSGMGAHYHVSIRFRDWDEIVRTADQHHLHLYLSDSGGGNSIWQTDLTPPSGLVICNEAGGASDEAQKFVSNRIHIPMPGQFESLNASTAAAILLFEVVRQRTSS
jgi:RNA methyltransferase, TrmH family